MPRRKKQRVSALSVLVLLMTIAVLIVAAVFIVRLCNRDSNNILKGITIETAEYTTDEGKTATRGYIRAPYSSFEEIDSTMFKNYVNSISGKYSRFTIILNGGDGIVLTNGKKDSIQYGYIDGNGAITESFGSIVLKNKKYKLQAN